MLVKKLRYDSNIDLHGNVSRTNKRITKYLFRNDASVTKEQEVSTKCLLLNRDRDARNGVKYDYQCRIRACNT